MSTKTSSPGPIESPEPESLPTFLPDPVLGPSSSEVCRVFHDGKATWEGFVRVAEGQERGSWPVERLNPYALLQHIPAFPARVPQARGIQGIHGRPSWHVPGLQPEEAGLDLQLEENWDPGRRHGPDVWFQVENPDPVVCDVSEDSLSFRVDRDKDVTGSLAVLTLAWGYIFSARMLERQNRGIHYTAHRLHPTRWGDLCDPEGKQALIDLSQASPALIRWLCGILSPDLGWEGCGSEAFPPWVAVLNTSAIVIVLGGETASDADLSATYQNGEGKNLGGGEENSEERAPGSAEALELLIEFCELFGLGSSPTRSKGLTACDTAFLTAIALHLYSCDELKPCFPPPRLRVQRGKASTKTRTRTDNNDHFARRMRQYLEDMAYFTTLSLCWEEFPSFYWSVFWQPDITCNLVGPWFAAIEQTIRPFLDSQDLESLVKVFLARRPRSGIWWFAMFMLGDARVVDWIPRYLAETGERYSWGTKGSPSPLTKVWTGIEQSFLDYETTGSYMRPDDEVPREDWMRCRFHYKMQEDACPLLAWRPFGTVSKAKIEPELWPFLEIKGHNRTYLHFIWYAGPEGREKSVEMGYREDKKKKKAKKRAAISDDLLPEDLAMVKSELTTCDGTCKNLHELPSVMVTQRMMAIMVEDATYDRDWAITALEGQMGDYNWLDGFRGLAGRDSPGRESVDQVVPLLTVVGKVLGRWSVDHENYEALSDGSEDIIARV